GIILSKAVLNISNSRKNVPLFYVAISRNKKLDNLLFKDTFDLERLTAGSRIVAEMRAYD
ncbi:uncharacterized protein MYCGRDRAFT_50260, partial [Zymoseptoria tritici IPO323]